MRSESETSLETSKAFIKKHKILLIVLIAELLILIYLYTFYI